VQETKEIVMFASVIVGVDSRAGGRDAIALARQLADPNARLVLANVHPGVERVPPRGDNHAFEATLQAESIRLLEAERAAAGVSATLMPVASPSVGRGLHLLAESQSADLIVVGSTRHSLLGRVFIGDHTRNSLNGASCAVAIAPTGYSQHAHDITRVGVGFDGSRESELALAAARRLAARSGAKIAALSVVSLESIPRGAPVPSDWVEVAGKSVEEQLHRWDDCDDIEGDATYGEPSEELERFSDDLALLIVGSRGYGPLGRLMNGSTSSYLARRAHCPLLVLPRGVAIGDAPVGVLR
jgi:nucleotide-binding universal stress UspA family protein